MGLRIQVFVFRVDRAKFNRPAESSLWRVVIRNFFCVFEVRS